jgi:hypothetical protein
MFAKSLLHACFSSSYTDMLEPRVYLSKAEDLIDQHRIDQHGGYCVWKRTAAADTCMQGERGFHIFYQMLRGATVQERLAWKLPKRLEDFRYLNGTGAVTSIEGIDDAADFRAVRAAMTAVNITSEQQHAIFSVVSAVLWLGNIAFTAKSDDAVRVEKDEAFTTCSELLALPCSALEFALTHRLMTVGPETYERPLNLGNALDTRDALAKVCSEENSGCSEQWTTRILPCLVRM